MEDPDAGQMRFNRWEKELVADGCQDKYLAFNIERLSLDAGSVYVELGQGDYATLWKFSVGRRFDLSIAKLSTEKRVERVCDA